MATQTHGEYSAFETPSGVRFQRNKRMISEKSVPPEVAALLKSKFTPKFAMPTEEEKARLRAESLKVPVELARTDAQMEAARPLTPVQEPEIPVDPLTEDDFDIDVGASAEQGADMSAIQPDEPDPATVDPDFLESVSIHSASIQDIAEALNQRFGVYTVYLGRLPIADEVNPFTAEAFNKYHLGIAYQAAIRAEAQGVLQRPAEEGRKSIDASRTAAENFQVDPQPRTMGEARRANSFAYRTSVRATQSVPTTEIVHEMGKDGKMRAVRREIPEGEIGHNNGANQRYDADEDMPIVEPAFGKQVIRPNWADNK